MNDKKFSKTVESISKLPAPDRVRQIEAVQKSAGNFGLKPVQETKLERMKSLALA